MQQEEKLTSLLLSKINHKEPSFFLQGPHVSPQPHRQVYGACNLQSHVHLRVPWLLADTMRLSLFSHHLASGRSKRTEATHQKWPVETTIVVTTQV